MAYARPGLDCDLYVYKHVGGGYVCGGCKDWPPGVRMNAKKMYVHLCGHYNQDDKFPIGLLGTFGMLAEDIEVQHVDPVLAEMVVKCRTHNPPGKICSDDADVPADLRITSEQAAALLSGDDPPRLTTTRAALAEVEQMLQKDAETL